MNHQQQHLISTTTPIDQDFIKNPTTTTSYFTTHLGWPGGIDLGLGSVLLLKVSGSILFGTNLSGLI